jgi:Ca-activated chloride channel family protein
MKRLMWAMMPHAAALLAGGVGVSYAVQHFEWAMPWAWALLAFAVALLGLRIWRLAAGRYPSALLNLPTPEAEEKLGNRMLHAVTELPFALRNLALIFLAIAAGRPQSSSSIEDLTREGIDIVLALDLSASMLSKDFDPNRLEASKNVAAEFVEARPDDRIGVVAYEGEAFTQVPLTTDQRVVMNGIASLETGLLTGGTAIGMGLATAVTRLRDSEADSKVIILLTDGVNNSGAIEPVDAAQLAKLNNIRVYTIGVGTIGKARSPVAKSGDRYRYDWVEVKIDEDVLKNIARETGGRYFRATNEEKLAAIYDEIDELEKTRFNVLRYNQKTEEFLPFALIAALALLGEFLCRTYFIRSIA